MAINIDGDGLIALGGTASTQGRLRLAEDTDNGTNYIELTAPASVGSDRVITFPDGTGSAVVNGINGSIVSGTAVASTSGTSIDFTGIPAYVKRVTVMFDGVSTNGTSNLLLQIGDSGGIENTGYISGADYSSLSASSTAGYILLWGINLSSDTLQGSIIVSNLSANTWVTNGNMADNSGRNSSSAGSKTLSATLDRVRITTVNGTDTFDAGSINILYE